MSAARYAPLAVGVILAVAVVAYAQLSLPSPSIPSATTLRVGYPDSLDPSTVSDLMAYSQILPAEGINVVPTFYDAPSLSYKGLVAGQQDIGLISSNAEFIGVPQGAQTTVVTCYALAGTFLMVASDGITKPAQLLGKSVDDFGPGSQTRALNLYWLAQAGVKTNANGPAADSVYVRASGGNIARVHDLETGVAQGIAVDDFTLSQLRDPVTNVTSNHGPFHVLFYAPNNVVSVCYAVRDDWLGVSANQQVLVKWIAAIIQAQRNFISNPQVGVSFAASQLPLAPPGQIPYVSTFYPQHYTYWPYGIFNLQGDLTVNKLLDNTNNFLTVAGTISQPLQNSSVKPYGVFNKWFEFRALQQLGPYQYPCQSWVNAAFIANLNAWVPPSSGSAPAKCASSAAAPPALVIASVGSVSLLSLNLALAPRATSTKPESQAE